MTDLEKIYDAIVAKRPLYTVMFKYYNGDHPLIYSTERLQTIFKNIKAKFIQNWCKVIVDAMLDRIKLLRFTVADDEPMETLLNNLFQATELNIDAIEIHLATMLTGEAFVFSEANDSGGIDVFYNDPRLCHVVYDKENPRLLLYAGKWYLDNDGVHYITLYYPDRFEYYEGNKDPQTYQAFRLIETAPNPSGRIPITHFRRSTYARFGELDESIISMQNAVNKLFSDMMVAAEFGAAPQRYIISNAEVDPSQVKNAPGFIWALPAGDGAGQQTSVGQFASSDLSNYLTTMDSLSQSMATISRTPRHYFTGAGGTPSGEALIAMESPLTAKCEQWIARLKPTWRRLAWELVYLLTGQALDPMAIEPIFDNPATIQPLSQANIREINVRAGLPLETILQQEGWSQSDIEAMQAAKSEETLATQTTLSGALAQSRQALQTGHLTSKSEGQTTMANQVNQAEDDDDV